MSNEVFALVKRRVVGSPTMKSVLLYMADSASDDGTGIWCSKATIAADLEFKSKRTVQTAIQDLSAQGLVEKVGKRNCNNGYVDEYKIVLPRVSQLASTVQSRGAQSASLPRDLEQSQSIGVKEMHLTGAGNAPLTQHLGGAGNARVQETHLTGAGNAPDRCRKCTQTIMEPLRNLLRCLRHKI